MYDYPVSYLIQFLLEAGAFLVIAGVGVARRGDGLWAALAAIGGALASVVALVQLVVYVEAKYLQTSHLQDFIFQHGEGMSQVLGWSRVAGFVLIAAALVVRTRTSRSASVAS